MMDPITVRWNGPVTVDGVTESPDEKLTAGKYVALLVGAHDVPGTDHHLVFQDGEPVPDNTAIELLGGLTVLLRATPVAGDEDTPEVVPARKATRARKAPAKKARAARKPAAKKPAKKAAAKTTKKQ